jgi:thiamine biosynthesis lipoprotein
MGTVFSIHVLGADAESGQASQAARDAFEEVQRLEEIFSPFRPNSQVSQIRRGDLSLEQAHPLVREVEIRCRHWQRATDGRFSAWFAGEFDPTGLVKGWAAERVFVRCLEPLLLESGYDAVGLGAGGDIRVATRPGADWCWDVGIADPGRQGAVLSTVQLRNGAVATSGTAERGAHVLNPSTGLPTTSTVSASVVARDLESADCWATAALVAGVDDLGWIERAGTISGLVVGANGAVRRWRGNTVLDAAPPA